MATAALHCVAPRKAGRWVLPGDFQGCVEVFYGVEGAPPLPREDGFPLIEVPPPPRELVPVPAGRTSFGHRDLVWRVVTSDEQQFGEHAIVETYLLEDGNRQKRYIGMGGASSQGSRLTCFDATRRY